MIRLYLSRDRIQNYQNPFTLETKGLKKKVTLMYEKT
jgi:hypothetical protein